MHVCLCHCARVSVIFVSERLCWGGGGSGVLKGGCASGPGEQGGGQFYLPTGNWPQLVITDRVYLLRPNNSIV